MAEDVRGLDDVLTSEVSAHDTAVAIWNPLRRAPPRHRRPRRGRRQQNKSNFDDLPTSTPPSTRTERALHTDRRMTASIPPAPVLNSESSRLLRIDRARLRSLSGPELSVCFAVHGEAPGRGRCVEAKDGSLILIAEAQGRIEAHSRRELVVNDGGQMVHLRYILPEGIALELPRGRFLRAEVQHAFHDRGPTVDARLWDGDGELLLWARHGELPTDGTVADFAVRVAHDLRGRPRLAVATRDTLASVAVGQVGNFQRGSSAYELVTLRIGDEDSGFLLARA